MKKFCIVMMICIIGVISGCCNTSQIGSDDQSGEASEKEFDFSNEVAKRGFWKIRILKDNKYGNEYIIVEDGDGLSICPRIIHN